MSLGEKVLNAFGQFIMDNSFYVVVMVTLVLFVLDLYNRYVRVNKDTDSVDLAQRWVYLEYYRTRAKLKK